MLVCLWGIAQGFVNVEISLGTRKCAHISKKLAALAEIQKERVTASQLVRQTTLERLMQLLDAAGRNQLVTV